MMCRVGSVVAPFCVYLADVWIYLPQVNTFFLLHSTDTDFFMFHHQFLREAIIFLFI